MYYRSSGNHVHLAGRKAAPALRSACRLARCAEPAAQLRGWRPQLDALVAGLQLSLHAAPALQADALQPACERGIRDSRHVTQESGFGGFACIAARVVSGMSPRPSDTPSRWDPYQARPAPLTCPTLGEPGRARWSSGASARAGTPAPPQQHWMWWLGSPAAWGENEQQDGLETQEPPPQPAPLSRHHPPLPPARASCRGRRWCLTAAGAPAKRDAWRA